MQHSRSRDGAAPLPDMNLLPALDALLRAGGVAGAAAELSVSPSAMSRTLGGCAGSSVTRSSSPRAGA